LDHPSASFKSSTLLKKDKFYRFDKEKPYIPSNYVEKYSMFNTRLERWRLPKLVIHDYKRFGVLEKIYP